MVHWGHVSVPGDGDEVADDAEGADKEEGEGGRARYRLLGHDLYSMATLNRLLLTDFSYHHNTLCKANSTELAKKVCPRLRDLATRHSACWRSGEFTQPTYDKLFWPTLYYTSICTG